MGRRPHAVVTEFFVRGEKLGDQSNRYAHSCRRCGEHFAKGRVDNLVAHVLRRCPGVSQDEKNFVFRSIQQGNSDVSRAILDRHLHEEPSLLAGPTDHGFLDAENISTDVFQAPLVPRGPSALDTLAEVSRRHLDFSAQHQNFESRQQFDDFDTSHQFWGAGSIAEQLEHAARSPEAQSSPAEFSRVLYEVPADAEEPILSQPSPTLPFEAAVPTNETVSHVPQDPTAGRALPLVQTASAANERLEQDASYEASDALDPGLNVGEPTADQGAPSIDVNEMSNTLSWNPVVTPNAHTFESLVAYPTKSGFGLLRQGGKNRIRGRFESERRKEVQQIRKQGACMRCRMLKKPCSEGTPCKTCQGIESARLWKGKCLRTRLVDEFLLWRFGLFHSKAKIQIPAAIYGLPSRTVTGCLEVRLLHDSEACMTFRTRKYDPGLVQYRSGTASEQAFNSSRSRWILDEAEGMTSKIEVYVNQIVNTYIGHERNAFIKATLQLAQTMIKPQVEDTQPSSTEQSKRSGYTLQQNQLLNNVVELWVETCTLTSDAQADIQLRYNAQRTPEQRSVVSSWDTDNMREEQRLPRDSEDLIRLQILAATESRCLALSKVVINELERRLLQRQQVSRFSTYLSTIILLNCIERMTGMYRKFEPTAMTDGSTAMRPAHWPLEKPPAELYPQGQNFADLVIMLLRMRALPPKTSTDSSGNLIVATDATPVPITGTGKSMSDQTDEHGDLPALWLDPMGLKEEDLVRIRDAPIPGPEDDVAAWDLKFISKLLLPPPQT